MEVLGLVLTEARELLARSPEQVGAATGLSGRTIRRLEAGLSRRPHTTTLEVLAEYYALDAELLHQLVAWSELDGGKLLQQLARLDDSSGEEEPEAVHIACELPGVASVEATTSAGLARMIPRWTLSSRISSP